MDEAVVEVSDTGIGIGLTLARRLIELHEGRIEARSGGAGAGTTFSVRLPLLAALAEQKPRADRGRGTTAPCCRVLIAEDIPDAAEMMRLMIECMGHARCV